MYVVVQKTKGAVTQLFPLSLNKNLRVIYIFSVALVVKLVRNLLGNYTVQFLISVFVFSAIYFANS